MSLVISDTAWDAGVTWFLTQAAADGPDYDTDPLALDFILEHHLRSAHPEAEMIYVDHLRRVSLQEAERITERALLPQWFELVLDRFPVGPIVLPRPPLIQVTSITYVDDSGATIVLSGSPEPFVVELPEGTRSCRARVSPLGGTTWPSIGAPAPNAVRVRFQAGYPGGAFPDEINQGRLAAIAEMHKQRSESVHISQSAAMRVSNRYYKAYKVYGN
jgi:uncharacterized phiE125 gp8 family phage protein